MDFRFLKKTDFDNGYLTLLKRLTFVGNITREDFEKTFDVIEKNPYHFIFVVTLTKSHGITDDNIIACGTLLIEPKFIHKCSFVGHIEDIVVGETFGGRGIGSAVVEHLTKYAKEKDCYKVILDCADNFNKFYKKCDFKRNGSCMGLYF